MAAICGIFWLKEKRSRCSEKQAQHIRSLWPMIASIPMYIWSRLNSDAYNIRLSTTRQLGGEVLMQSTDASSDDIIIPETAITLGSNRHCFCKSHRFCGTGDDIVRTKQSQMVESTAQMLQGSSSSAHVGGRTNIFQGEGYLLYGGIVACGHSTAQDRAARSLIRMKQHQISR